MLGCKFAISSRLAVPIGELIDTCWDVNRLALCFAGTCVFELIDTCWDVNYVFAIMLRMWVI